MIPCSVEDVVRLRAVISPTPEMPVFIFISCSHTFIDHQTIFPLSTPHNL
ncbi:hypothetical protein HMPREF1545_01863 [Oscillibacter sp. KLE 1728]|nr:hypothetical protein HMPREF1545_01863 [Oscillibacter sp. KLE 1728]